MPPPDTYKEGYVLTSRMVGFLEQKLAALKEKRKNLEEELAANNACIVEFNNLLQQVKTA